jgi:hypothetical protein
MTHLPQNQALTMPMLLQLQQARAHALGRLAVPPLLLLLLEGVGMAGSERRVQLVLVLAAAPATTWCSGQISLVQQLARSKVEEAGSTPAAFKGLMDQMLASTCCLWS